MFFPPAVISCVHPSRESRDGGGNFSLCKEAPVLEG